VLGPGDAYRGRFTIGEVVLPSARATAEGHFVVELGAGEAVRTLEARIAPLGLSVDGEPVQPDLEDDP
jgi:hypothetical protein